MNLEKKKILRSLLFPSLFIVLLWIIKIGEMLTHIDLGILGVYPRSFAGLYGILTSPLVHADLKHLFANSVPLFVLGGCLFYFYREISIKTFFLLYFIPGLCVWVGARESYHIGASGVVYGLASFLFFSGIFRRDGRLLAITMLVTFLYGSMVWGIFPDFYPEENISWESHLWGLVTGMILAFYFRKLGPQRKKYDWECEEEDEEEVSVDNQEQHETKRSIEINYTPPEKK
jgi:membrane associated rhomboid family serine protease